MPVCADGVTTYTDGEGFFRLEGLPPGLHTLVAISPDGSYQPFQQGAVIAAGSATPAELDLIPAPLVEVALQVTVPENTPTGMAVRIAGNLSQLGNSFVELLGGLWSSGAGLPSLAQVDESHYVFLADLPAGTDLRYRYTLGDGRWNAEADAEGMPVIRELIVPSQDTLVQDLVVSWGPGTYAPVTFHVTVPENSSATDGVSLQLNPSTWLEPLPMTRLGPNDWSFVLYPPADVGATLHYRYCRDRLCRSAGDADSGGGDFPGRALTLGPAPQEVQDAVRAWQWWGADLSPAAVASAEIAPRARFEAGVEWLPLDELAWSLLPPQALADVVGLGANALTLTPAWVMAQNSPLPVLAFDPAYGPTRSRLFEAIHRAHELGLQVGLHPTLLQRYGEPSAWWRGAPLDEDWWRVWFESYRSFVVTYASLASEAGAEELILGGPEVALALPGGQRPDGQPAWVPVDSEIRWRELIAEVRSCYQGRLAFEVELGQTLQLLPPFLDAVDEVHVYWHAPLGSGTAPTSADMRVAAATLVDGLLGDPALAGKPIVLSVEYLSVDGGAAGCIPAARGQVCSRGFLRLRRVTCSRSGRRRKRAGPGHQRHSGGGRYPAGGCRFLRPAVQPSGGLAGSLGVRQWKAGPGRAMVLVSADAPPLRGKSLRPLCSLIGRPLSIVRRLSSAIPGRQSAKRRREMDFELTEEQRMWRQAVHDFSAQEVKPKAAEMDTKAELNAEAIRKMGPLGLLGLNVSEEFGGAGRRSGERGHRHRGVGVGLRGYCPHGSRAQQPGLRADRDVRDGGTEAALASGHGLW